MEEREPFRGAMACVFVRVTPWFADGFPALTGTRDRLVGARFVLAPDRHSRGLGSCVRLLNQPFFRSASGSTTVTTPAVRLRRAVPVGHQVRVRCQR